MKSKLSILFIFIMSVLTASSCIFAGAATQVYSDAGLTYTVNSDSTATVTGFSGEVIENLTIPETLGGYTVTAIGSSAFENCTSLTSIELPDNVEKIEINAFAGCTELLSVDLANVRYIGIKAFNGCLKLKSIVIPNTLLEAHNGAYSVGPFSKTGIETVVFEEGITKIPDYVCLAVSNLKSVTIPDSVTTIGEEAFGSCTALERITLPEALTEIGASAFENCTSLTSIELPDNVEEIGFSAFAGCTELLSVDLANVRYIGIKAFNGCLKLKSIVIPNTLLETYNGAYSVGPFAKTGIETVVFEEGITKIPDYVCLAVSNLKNVTIPEGVTTIGNEAFGSCTALTEISLPSTLKTVSADAIFSGCKKLSKVIFAEGTVKIANNVCKSAPAITQIVIPDTVKTIGNSAFANCKTLKTIDLNKVETLEASAFSGCTGLTAITVPETLKYTTGSAGPFNKCSNITSIIFEGTTIPSYFCRDMAALHTIDMKNGLTDVGKNAFYAVDNLKTFIIRDRSCAIPDTEEAIPSGATIYGYELSTAQEYADKYNRSFVALEASDSYEAVADYVRRQMINRNRYIILAYPQGAPALTSNNDFVKFFDAVFAYDKADSAAGDNLRWSVKKINRSVLDDGYLVLDVEYYTTAEQESLLAGKLTEIAASLQLNDKPEYEKARLIFEYLCDNANAVSPNDKAYNDVHHSAYSVLVNNSGVCEGFSLAFYRLALEAGLDTRVVVSDKLLHACNIVRIADKWYYLDTYLAADEDDSSRGDVFYFLKSSVEAQFIGNDYTAFTPVYENEENWALTPAKIKAYSFAESDYIADGGCGHILEFIGYTGQPCSGTGKEEYKCPKCGNEFSRNCKLGHTALSGSIRCQWCNKNLCKHEEQYRTPVPERKATCTEEGLTSYEYCSRCKEHNFSEPELIPATGHSDKNNDGVCDQCGTTIGKKENSFIAKIKQFFGKISRFLARLFGKKK